MKFKKCTFGRNATEDIFPSQYLIAESIRLVCSHINNDNFDKVVNEVSVNFLYCIDIVFLIVLIGNTERSKDYDYPFSH